MSKKKKRMAAIFGYWYFASDRSLIGRAGPGWKVGIEFVLPDIYLPRKSPPQDLSLSNCLLETISQDLLRRRPGGRAR